MWGQQQCIYLCLGCKTKLYKEDIGIEKAGTGLRKDGCNGSSAVGSIDGS
jgi:hypothetical protein